MPPKKKGKRKAKKEKGDGDEKTVKKGKGGSKKAVVKSSRKEGKTKGRLNVDIFNEHAMQNAYYTCHNVQDLLRFRGFPWPEAQKKKKKGRKK